MPKYLYCITKNYHGPAPQTTGVAGSTVHSFDSGDFTCFMSDSDKIEKELDRESAIAHEKVLEEIMDHTTIIPVAFGHIAGSEDEIKEKFLDSHEQKLAELLAYLENKAELSLKAFWLDLAPVFKEIAENSREIKRLKAQPRITRAAQIRAGEMAAQALGRKREALEKELATYLGEYILEYKQAKLFGDQMITNLAFLIQKPNLDKMDALVNKYAARLDANIKLKYTGPVPPFNFVDLKISQ